MQHVHVRQVTVTAGWPASAAGAHGGMLGSDVACAVGFGGKCVTFREIEVLKVTDQFSQIIMIQSNLDYLVAVAVVFAYAVRTHWHGQEPSRSASRHAGCTVYSR